MHVLITGGADVLSVSEDRSDLRTVEWREVFPGLPGGPGLDQEPLEVTDELLSGARTAEEIAGPDGLLAAVEVPAAKPGVGRRS